MNNHNSFKSNKESSKISDQVIKRANKIFFNSVNPTMNNLNSFEKSKKSSKISAEIYMLASAFCQDNKRLKIPHPLLNLQNF